MTAVRHSRQRDAIYTELCSRGDHPTADELYATLRQTMPNLSLATVYRNLHQLAEAGQVNILYTSAADHFDAVMKPHYHLYCRQCHRIYDADIPLISEIDRAAQNCTQADIDSYSLVFEGICEHCANQH